MAGAPFDRRVWNFLEKELSVDKNTAEAQSDLATRFFFEKFLSIRATDGNPAQADPSNGFVGDSFRVKPTLPLGMSVLVTRGLGLVWNPADLVANTDTGIAGTSGISDLSPYKPLVLTIDEPITIDPAPVAPNNRIDIIEVKYERRLSDNAVRFLLDPVNENFVANPNVPKTLTWDLVGRQGRVVAPNPSTAAIGYKVGTPAVAPVAPLPTAGYVKIAEIRVDAGVATLDVDSIADFRPMLFPHGVATCHATAVFNIAALAPPTLFNLNTPPGVRVITVAKNLTGAQMDVYVIAGSTQIVPNWQALVDQNFNNQAFVVGDVLPVTGVITAAEKTDIEGANAYPGGSLVAIGQPYSKITLRCVNISGAGVSDAPAVLQNPTRYRFAIHLGSR